MKKQPASKLVTTVRFTESQRADFEAAAQMEGFDSVVQWMLRLAERRVVALNEAVTSGRFVTIGNAKVPLSDIDPADLARAAEILLESQQEKANTRKGKRHEQS